MGLESTMTVWLKKRDEKKIKQRNGVKW